MDPRVTLKFHDGETMEFLFSAFFDKTDTLDEVKRMVATKDPRFDPTTVVLTNEHGIKLKSVPTGDTMVRVFSSKKLYEKYGPAKIRLHDGVTKATLCSFDQGATLDKVKRVVTTKAPRFDPTTIVLTDKNGDELTKPAITHMDEIFVFATRTEWTEEIQKVRCLYVCSGN